jgi:hypothetical protein
VRPRKRWDYINKMNRQEVEFANTYWFNLAHDRVKGVDISSKAVNKLLLLLFLTAIGFSPGGSSLTPVQTPQYNNTYINGTAQIALYVLAVHALNTMCLH